MASILTAVRDLDRLGRSLFRALVVAAFVVSGAWLLAASRHADVGVALVVFGVLVMLGHAFADLIERFRRR